LKKEFFIREIGKRKILVKEINKFLIREKKIKFKKFKIYFNQSLKNSQGHSPILGLFFSNLIQKNLKGNFS